MFIHKMQVQHSAFGQLTLGMGVFRRFVGSPDGKDLKKQYGFCDLVEAGIVSVSKQTANNIFYSPLGL